MRSVGQLRILLNRIARDGCFILFLLQVLSAVPLSSASSSSSTAAAGTATLETSPLAGIQPDPFVEAAPLIVAVSCRNGAIVLAAHLFGAEEPLVYDSNENVAADDDAKRQQQLEQQQSSLLTDHDEYSDDKLNNDVSKNDNLQVLKGTNDVMSAGTFRDLPENFKGPFRIHSVDGFGSVLVCAGWRADCEILVSACRSLMNAELSRFGPPNQNDGDDDGNGYARMIAMELSAFLAQCAVSEGTRTLSCVCLLVTPGSRKRETATCDDAAGMGRVWLVDSTGAYLVRGLCVGGGMARGEADGEVPLIGESSSSSGSGLQSKRIADRVNRKLMDTNWTEMETDHALRKLLQLLAEKEGDKSGDSTISSTSSTTANGIVKKASFLLEPRSHIEAAVVDSASGKFTRTRIAGQKTP